MIVFSKKKNIYNLICLRVTQRVIVCKNEERGNILETKGGNNDIPIFVSAETWL